MKKKILICDDDKEITQAGTLFLKDQGYEVKVLNKCELFEEKVKEYRPDLILLDLWMSEIDGEELTRLIKKDEETQKIPIIIISAYRQTEQKAREAGADDFIYKPFDIEYLEKMIRKYLT